MLVAIGSVRLFVRFDTKKSNQINVVSQLRAVDDERLDVQLSAVVFTSTGKRFVYPTMERKTRYISKLAPTDSLEMAFPC